MLAVCLRVGLSVKRLREAQMLALARRAALGTPAASRSASASAWRLSMNRASARSQCRSSPLRLGSLRDVPTGAAHLASIFRAR
jgi:hypothetical protein